MTATPKIAEVRAVTYTRYSSDQQRASSIEDQRRNCERRAAAEGWAVIAHYADAAITGSDNRRPEYLKMQQAAARREFDVLIVDDLSRLTRDSVEQEMTLRRLEFQGIRIIATSDGYDSKSKARKIQRGFKGLMNEMFLDDLRDKVHRGLEGQAIKGRWCGGRPYGYRLKAITDPSRLDAYGNPSKIGTSLAVDADQAAIVRQIFERFAAGDSCKTIARVLNARSVASPGSTWKRVIRRSNGWVASGVRGIVINPLYTGALRWNVSRFEKDPDTGKSLRRRRPQTEWVVHQVEALRIVTDELFASAQARTRPMTPAEKRLKAGGSPKYLLSGLLKCDVCSAHYVIADKYSYACSAFLGGGGCANKIRVNRVSIEGTILNPVRDQLRDPAIVKQMAAEMERDYAAQMDKAGARAAAAPRELEELDARLERLRGGVADLEPDELAAAIARIEAKRNELKAAVPAHRDRAQVLALLPKAAAAYLKQVDAFAAGDARATQKIRLVLKEIIGPIRLAPESDGSLWATYKRLDVAALVRTAGTSGRGDRI
ncbi:MAG: recombinase family protein [Steroidobacteraceae bacterium]